MKKNILISVYDMEIGGIERSLINMLESFDYERYSVDLLVFHHTGEFMELIPKNVNVLPEVKQYSVFRKPIAQCIKEGHYLTSAIRVISKPLAKIKAMFSNLEEGPMYIQMQLAIRYSSYFLPKLDKEYDVAISFAWPHDILSRIVNAKRKIAWIHTDYSKLEIDNKLDLQVWEEFDYIASVSDECTKSFLTQYPSLSRRIFTLENITSPNVVRNLANEEVECIQNNNESFNIVSVGRLSHVKGFDMAVEALRKLHDYGLSNINWYVVGYGGYEIELKKLIAKRNLNNHFILLGKKANPYPYINAADLYVQPSRYEGKAVTVTEAKILGKPILITNYPTASSQLEDKVDGYICEMGVNAITEGIHTLLKNDQLRNYIATTAKSRDYSNLTELNKLYDLIEN